MPLFKDKIWGGNKIKELGFDYSPLPNCGELWALSAVEGSESVIANGFLEESTLNEALEIYMGELIGEANYDRFGNQFPLLIKIIDANDRLSIQVHPDDQLAQERDMDYGKTEMWYIMQADPQAEIIDGFSTPLTPDQYQALLTLGKLESALHVEHPQAGDLFFIPAGRVHAIGKGILLAEVQQSSDCTYRIYDYNRRDTQGRLRELHTQEALDAIDFTPTRDGRTHYHYQPDHTVPLAECPYFTTNLIALTEPMRKDFSSLDSFVIYLCTEGIAAVRALDHIVPLHAGECVLVPAVAGEVELHCHEGHAKLLEVYIDPEQYDGPEMHRGEISWISQFMSQLEEEEDHDCHHDHCDCGHDHHDHDCDCGHDHHDHCDCHHDHGA